MSKAGFPRIVQRSVTPGTGPFQLLPSRETSFGLFRDRLVDGDVVGVMIVNPGKNEWQECLCTFNLGSPDTITPFSIIASSAVADAAVTFTAGSKLVMLTAASYTLWAAEKLRPPVRCAVKTNQTLASITAGSTLDGLTMAAGQRFALLNQTTATEIGLYKIAASGAPTRCKDFSAGDTVNAAIVPIAEGTYAGAYAFCTSVAGSDIVGTSSLTWSLSGPGVWQPLDATLTALAGANWVANAIPIGTGADTVAQTTFAANTFPARSSSGNMVAKTITDFALSLVDDADAATARTTLGLGTVATLASDTDGTLAANSDARVATQKAVKTYVDTAVTGLLDFKGSQDCSANPNYPAGLKGDAYLVTVAGKIGGASGKSVDVGDVFAASADNAGGTEASVGTSWFVLEHNLVGALLAANNLSDLANAATAVNNLGGATSTGTGGLVRLNGPTLVAPTLGAASATSINKMAITAPATGSTLAVADGKTLTASNTLTLAGTDGSSLNVGAGGTLGALAFKSSVALSDQASLAANSLIGNPTGSSATPSAVGWTSNLKITSSQLDTAQDIQTTSSPQFAKVKTPIVFPASDSTTAVQVTKADGSTPVLVVDTTNSRLGVGVTPSSKLHVASLGTAGATSECLRLSYTNALNTSGFVSMYVGNATTETQRITYGLGATTDSYLAFSTYGGSLSEKMRLDGQGNLLLGHSGTALGKIEGRATSGAQLVASYDATHSLKMTVDLNGDCKLDPTRNIGIGVTPGARLDIGLNTAFPGNIQVGTYAFLGQQDNSGSMVFGYNAKADEAINNRAVVANTNGVVGYSFMRIGSNGIEWHTVTGSVTAGNVASSPRMNLNTAGDLCVGSHSSALGHIDSRSTSGAQLVASYDASNSLSWQVNSGGLATFTGAGTSKGIVLTDGLQAGTGASRVQPGGTLKTIVTAAPNSGTGETDLHSVTVPANTLANDGDSVEIQQNFQIVNNGSNKTIKFYVNGGAPIFNSGAAVVGGQPVQILVTITRVSSSSTMVALQFIPATGSAWARGDTVVEISPTWSGSIVIKATGQGAASNEIVQRSTVVKYNRANP